MPQFDTVSDSRGGRMGVAEVVTPEQARKAEQRNRKQFKIPRRNAYTMRASSEHQVYIYNASPWPHEPTLGSYGSRYIPALDESLVLSPDLYVAGPLIIPGIPGEPIQIDEQRMEWQDHAPIDGSENQDKAGLDFANEVCRHDVKGSNPQGDLCNQGVFISEIRGFNPAAKEIPQDPKKLPAWITAMNGHYFKGTDLDGKFDDPKRIRTEALKIYTEFRSTQFHAQWCQMVRDAQQKFLSKCNDICLEAQMAYEAEKFYTVSPDFPRLKKAAGWTGQSWAFTKNLGRQDAGMEPCRFCTTPVAKEAVICPKCTQVLDGKKFEEMRHRPGVAA